MWFSVLHINPVDQIFANPLLLITPMNKFIRLALGSVVAVIVAAFAQAQNLPAGAYSIGVAKGDVTYKLAGTTTYLPATAGTPLPQGATIKTGAGSIATVVFGTGSVATVRPNSEIEVTKFEQAAFTGTAAGSAEPSQSKTNIKVVNGEVIAKVAKLRKGSEFTVNSPIGAAGVRGTVLSVRFDSATRKGRVAVLEGVVEFTTATGERVTSAITVTLVAGKAFVTFAPGAPGTTATRDEVLNEVADLKTEDFSSLAEAINQALVDVKLPPAVTKEPGKNDDKTDDKGGDKVGPPVPDVDIIGVTTSS